MLADSLGMQRAVVADA